MLKNFIGKSVRRFAKFYAFYLAMPLFYFIALTVCASTLVGVAIGLLTSHNYGLLAASTVISYSCKIRFIKLRYLTWSINKFGLRQPAEFIKRKLGLKQLADLIRA